MTRHYQNSSLATREHLPTPEARVRGARSTAQNHPSTKKPPTVGAVEGQSGGRDTGPREVPDPTITKDKNMTTVATEPQAEQTRAHGDEPAWPAPTDLPAAPPWATAVTDLHWAGALDNYYHRGYHREWRSPRGGIWAYVSGNQTFHRDGSIEDDGVEMETFDATIESNADAVAYAAAIREATTLLAKINDGFFDRPNLPPAPDWCETDQVDQLDDELTGDRNFFAPTDTFSDHEGECVEVSGQVEQVLHKGVVVEQKAIVYVDVTGAAITPATARAVAAKLIEHADLVEAAVR